MRFKCRVFRTITGRAVEGTSRDEEDVKEVKAYVTQLCEQYPDPDFVVRIFSTTVSSSELIKLHTLSKYRNIYLCDDHGDILLLKA